MSNNFAPLALFVYNRLKHTSKTIEALRKNEFAKNSDLIIYSDGPKNKKDYDNVEEVRNYLKEITGFAKIRIIERETNIGLATSIILGVTEIIKEYGKIIVLEDDMVTSPYFIRYMNDALTLFENEEKVISIHGYVYPITGLPEYFLIRGADCWGWSTWKRGWDLFEPDGRKLLSKLKDENLTQEFDINNSYPYTKMLIDQIDGKNDSWAIRWYASAFLNNKFTLYPGKSFVDNIGLDDSGTHCNMSSKFNVELNQNYSPLINQCIEIKQNEEAIQMFESYFKHINKKRILRNILEYIMRKK
ncbi:glycosyltransferase family 2 protein [Methanolobus vulcani]|uniref:Glycosyltransferase family 2 protein n=1 Tax=Methanolobus vulcani TaxID=38026 RepID=A0A7Z8P1H8_9EURY|nr:glycosyltransferase [Methanolobus vulcani]TQD23852.1 glycosyltransferase family 2 protein [Methanolobus vulcani]